MTNVYNAHSANNQRTQKTIVIVEDNEAICLLLKDILTFEREYDAIFFMTGAEALERIRETNPRLLVLDYNLPDINGIVLYDQLHVTQSLEEVPALVISAALPVGIVNEIKKRNITFLQKPFSIRDLIHFIKRLAS